jgi:hypothetical protein
VAADAPTTDGSITPVRDINRWPKAIGNALIRQNISDLNPAGRSNGLANGLALKFSY